MRRVNLLHAHGSSTRYLEKGIHGGCHCVVCRAAKAESQRKFRANHPGKAAKDSREYRANHPYLRDEDRRRRLLREYGISPEEYDALLTSQDGRCCICGADYPGANGWHIDHCHKTGVVRGILCHRCNLGLGNFRDDPERLAAAIEYLAAAV
jgi:hypothetical protein